MELDVSDPAASSSNTRELAVLRDFYCEHTASKSRVLALVAHPDGPPSLKAVLTCRDAEQAQQAAEILRGVLGCGSPVAPELSTQVESVAREMSDAVAASFRQAIDFARTGGWLVVGDQLSWRPGKETEAALNSWRTRVEENTLGRLRGPVIRQVTFTEYLVTDPVAFYNSATSMGWCPSGPFPGVGLGAPLHLMEATDFLAAPAPDLPGAQVLGTGSSIDVLDPEIGDELADWSPSGFSVRFGPGWRFEDDPGGPGMSEEEWEQIVPLPDFAALFPLERACPDWQFTPRAAYVLHALLSVLGDEAHDVARSFGDEPLREEHKVHCTIFTELPETTWSQGYAWRRDVARAAADLAQDIACGRLPRPRCVAEQVTLDCALDMARGHAEGLAGVTPSYDRLPRHRDDDWGAIEEIFLDVGEPSDDGLPPLWDTPADQWFALFRGVTSRDKNRGYPEHWKLMDKPTM
ncbi:hypothetical protein ACH4VR_40415 [Streptomyces sp. NPDC020883]|uniref:hypothetical protein n=1 Tax=Streptomyces sp. NPDC020883 TaxID=3365099 RepID=UPI0037B6C23A